MLASAFATAAHLGQVRKYTGEPYIEHPLAVAHLYAIYASNYEKESYDAALLHDTVEDTAVTLEDVQKGYGDKVAEYVWYLTKPPAFVGDRDQRKALDRDRLSKAPVTVRFIKLLDIMHNSNSIREHDPEFFQTFAKESERMIQMMNYVEVLDQCANDAGRTAIREWLPTILI